MNEQQKIKEILLNLKPNQRRFRINCGTGWVGSVVRHTGKMLVLQNPRPLKAAPKGWHDLVGFDSIEITPDMVGKRIAVFATEEIKMTGKLSAEQKSFGKMVSNKIGRAHV